MDYKNKLFLKLFLLFFISLGYAKTGIAQSDKNGKIVAFHPSVGNSINLSEKKEFLLFTEYNDSLFESAQLIKYDIDSYTVLFKTTTGQSFEKPIPVHELDAIYSNIEKTKPAASSTDDYVEKNQSKEKEIKKDRSQTGFIVAEITIQIVFVLLEILAHSY